MKPIYAVLGGVLMILGALPMLAQTPPSPSTPIAPPSTGRARLGSHEVASGILEGQGDNAKRVIIVYGRPLMRNPRGGDARKIWGTLVPWDKVWRLGADEATLLVTPDTLQFGDVALPPGVCSVYLLPSENGTSKLIFNKKVGQWGINGQGDAYPDGMKETEIGRVDLKKDTLTTSVDPLTIVITPKQGGGGGTVKICWETTQYSVDFTVKK